MADDEMEIRHRPGYQGAHPYHSKTANHQVTPNDTARTDGGALPHERRTGALARSASRSCCKSGVVARRSHRS